MDMTSKAQAPIDNIDVFNCRRHSNVVSTRVTVHWSNNKHQVLLQIGQNGDRNTCDVYENDQNRSRKQEMCEMVELKLLQIRSSSGTSFNIPNARKNGESATDASAQSMAVSEFDIREIKD